MRKIDMLVVHHSESPGGDVAFLRHCHMLPKPKGPGFVDIGYHFLIGNGLGHGKWGAMEDGEVGVGREEDTIGAHARGNNRKSLGICLVGNFDETEPTHKQISSLIVLLTELCMKHSLDPFQAIFGHGELMSTACPGKRLSRMMQLIRWSVAARINLIEKESQSHGE